MPLGARSWVADGLRGALVCADGTIDWYGPLRADGPPWCWRLLDPAGAAVRVGPLRSSSAAHRRLPGAASSYRPGTNVAELVLGEAGRQVRVVDFLPWPGPNETPAGRLVRLVTALSGPVEVELEVLPAGPFRAAREVSAWEEGVAFDGVSVRGGFTLHPEPLGRDQSVWRGTRGLEAGESMVVTLDQTAARLPPLSVDAAHRLADQTAGAWRSWSFASCYDGPYRAAVERSLLAVRSLVGHRTGAPVAAGTTSLPRRAGGERTADAREVRWRDAAAAAAVLAGVGLSEDANAAEAWLRRAVGTHPLPWPAALDSDGGPLPEREEWGMAGWRRSQPVVTGRSGGRLDLDLYGDVVTAVHASQAGPSGARRTGPGPLDAAWPALAEAADWLADHWDQPDVGVWELAGAPARLVASRVQVWVALDRMARLARATNPLDLAAVTWQQAGNQVRRWLEANAVAPDGGLMRVPGEGGDRGPDDRGPDAALVRVAWQGPWPLAHPLVATTVDRVLERLGSGAFLWRYDDTVDDGVAGPDSPDLLASLWAVKALSRLERWEEAHERMQAVVGRGGPLGLLGEAVDPLSGELLGNLPSTATHLALVDAALSLEAGPR